MGQMTPILMDVDTGVDDALALMLAVSEPDVDLVAVTCCAGNVGAGQAVTNTLAVLELCGAHEVAVAMGSEAPLVVPLRTATSHGPHGLGFATPPPPRGMVSDRFGPELIVDLARQHEGELVLVATGPLTNIALALRYEPALPRLLGRLALMGGSFDHPGNTTPAAEFNIWVDPEAAAAVFNAFSVADRRPLVVGLNVTDDAQLTPGHLTALGGGEIADFVAAALRVKFEDKGFARMHDPVALALAVDPAFGATRAGTVDVELGGALTRAMTVVDWHGLWGRPPNADVAVSVDYDRFLDRLVERLVALS